MNTPKSNTLALVAKLVAALDSLTEECNSNDYFATKHNSEIEALNQAEEASREARKFLDEACSEHGTETVLDGQLDDWDGGNPDAPHQVRVEFADNRLEVTLWPVSAGDQPGGAGVNVLFEVNRGRPGVHLSLAGHDDTAMHLHVNPDLGIECVREHPSRHWTTATSQVYSTSRAEVWRAD